MGRTLYECVVFEYDHSNSHQKIKTIKSIPFFSFPLTISQTNVIS